MQQASATQPRGASMALREEYTENDCDSMNVPPWNSAWPATYLASATREPDTSEERERHSWFEFARRARDQWLRENPF